MYTLITIPQTKFNSHWAGNSQTTGVCIKRTLKRPMPDKVPGTLLVGSIRFSEPYTSQRVEGPRMHNHFPSCPPSGKKNRTGSGGLITEEWELPDLISGIVPLPPRNAMFYEVVGNEKNEWLALVEQDAHHKRTVWWPAWPTAHHGSWCSTRSTGG